MSASSEQKALTSVQIAASKGEKRLVMVTAYDYPSAFFADAAGVDMILVGDSLGMVMLGKQDTLSVTTDMMVHHCAAVTAARPRALVVCDMPFLSYEDSVKSALTHAGLLMAKGGARAVKMEGGIQIIEQVQALVGAGIPVMGHIGLTPQRVATLGGYKVQGREANAAKALMDEARLLQEAGCFALVLECVPQEVAAAVTKALTIPTIGIGAGADCDGQVLVFHDFLGMNPMRTPRFVKPYARLGAIITRAVATYANDVRTGAFPQEEHTFHLSEDELEDFEAMMRVSTTHSKTEDPTQDDIE